MDEVPAHQRRVILRRRGMRGGSGSFSAGVSTRSESLRSSAEGIGDAVDAAVDGPVDGPVDEPEAHDPPHDAIDVSDRIRRGDLQPPPPPPPERENPRMRLNQVALAGSQAYAKEYRLNLLHRLLMRRIPLDQIAAQLQVSISTVEKDRVELKKRLREAAKQLDIDEMIGAQNAVYDEVAGMALRIASAGAQRDENGNPVQAVPTAMRLAAMRTALAANADRTRFLNTAGVFDVLRFRRSEDGDAISDVQMLMQQTLELMGKLDDPEEAAPTPRRKGGFAPMSFDDADASGSANEIQEI